MNLIPKTRVNHDESHRKKSKYFKIIIFSCYLSRMEHTAVAVKH